MIRMKSVALAAILLAAAAGLPAGDVAYFQNLGFSPDGNHFLFGQYGVDETSAAPFADLFMVDVHRNAFVPNGVLRGRYTRPVGPGDNGQGALFNLLQKAAALIRRYKIDHVLTGRLLYVLLDGEEPLETLQFRDFQTGRSYRVNLVQNSQGSGREVRSAFHLLLTVQETGGRSRSFVIGLPDYFRSGVKRYRVARILLGPDERSLVFIIQREELDGTGADIRFMVETADIGS